MAGKNYSCNYGPARPGLSWAFGWVIALLIVSGIVLVNWPAVKDAVERLVPDVVMDSVRVGR